MTAKCVLLFIFNEFIPHLMKNLTLVLLFFIFYGTAHAQCDTIFLKDGSRILSVVEDVSSNEIRFRRVDNPAGPVYTVASTDIRLVIYNNGRRQTFELPGPPAPVTTTVVDRSSADRTLQEASRRINYSGPRLGASLFTEGLAADDIAAKGKQPYVTQFGWQFETPLFVSKTGMSGLAEFTALAGGMEQGMFLPSAWAAFGLRTRQGLEFSAGPALSAYGLAVVAAVSTSFKIDDVYFPITLSLVPNVRKVITEYTLSGKKVPVETHTGHRISLTIGFNTARK